MDPRELERRLRSGEAIPMGPAPSANGGDPATGRQMVNLRTPQGDLPVTVEVGIFMLLGDIGQTLMRIETLFLNAQVVGEEEPGATDEGPTPLAP